MKTLREFINESKDDLDSYIKAKTKGLKTGKITQSQYNSGGGNIPGVKHVVVDDKHSHQDIFDHLTKNHGFKKTQGYDPKPNQWDMSRNHESMTSKSDPIHDRKNKVSAHITQEHGGKTHLTFSKWPAR